MKAPLIQRESFGQATIRMKKFFSLKKKKKIKAREVLEVN